MVEKIQESKIFRNGNKAKSYHSLSGFQVLAHRVTGNCHRGHKWSHIVSEGKLSPGDQKQQPQGNLGSQMVSEAPSCQISIQDEEWCKARRLQIRFGVI